MDWETTCWVGLSVLLFFVWSSCLAKRGESKRGAIAVLLGLAVLVWKTGWWAPLWIFTAWVASFPIHRLHYLLGAHASLRWWEDFPQTDKEYQRRLEILMQEEPIEWRVRGTMFPCVVLCAVGAVQAFAASAAGVGALLVALGWFLCELRGALTIACMSHYEWSKPEPFGRPLEGSSTANVPRWTRWVPWWAVAVVLIGVGVALAYFTAERRSSWPSILVWTCAAILLSLAPSRRKRSAPHGQRRVSWVPYVIIAALVAWYLLRPADESPTDLPDTRAAVRAIGEEFAAVLRKIESGADIRDEDLVPFERSVRGISDDGSRRELLLALANAIERTGHFRVALTCSMRATLNAHQVVEDERLAVLPPKSEVTATEKLGFREAEENRVVEARAILKRVAAGPMTWTIPGGEPRVFTPEVADELVRTGEAYLASCQKLGGRLRVMAGTR